MTKNDWVTLLLLGHEKSTQHLEKTSHNCLLLLQFSPFWQRHTSDCLTEGRSAPPDWDHPLVSGGEREGKKVKGFRDQNRIFTRATQGHMGCSQNNTVMPSSSTMQKGGEKSHLLMRNACPKK